MQKERKKPQRKCMGCHEMKEKRELIRVVKNSEGVVSLDLTGKANGRGAYLCPSLSCLQKARKARRIERALSHPISEEIYDQMEKEITKYASG